MESVRARWASVVRRVWGKVGVVRRLLEREDGGVLTVVRSLERVL